MEDKCIYDIIMLEHKDKELIYESGKHSGFPDFGATASVGYYNKLEDAVLALNLNACDIREYVYDAAFILFRKPGLYQPCGPDERAYFVWNEQLQGFFQAEEPEIFKHSAI